jgi:D-xylose reductase
VRDAIQIGYRHLDCACDYGNEADVGLPLHEIIHSGTCRRDDLWITSKLWNTYHAPEHVRPACERSLHDLQLDYLDLYLIHFPLALKYVPFEKRYPPGWLYEPGSHDDQAEDAAAPSSTPPAPRSDCPRAEEVPVPIRETWRAMEDLVHSGLVRNIGVSNFNIALLRDLIASAEIQPAVLQVEMHPFLTQEKLLRFCRERSIAVTAFSPLGAASYVELGMATPSDSVLQQPAVQQAAAHHGKTPAQIVLRWAIQRGTAVIPKSTRADHLRENLAIFDFELSAEEMHAITALNKNQRFNDPGDFAEKAFNAFLPIYD